MPNDTEACDVDVRQYEGVRGNARLYVFPILQKRSRGCAHIWCPCTPDSLALMRNTSCSSAGVLMPRASRRPRTPTAAYSRRLVRTGQRPLDMGYCIKCNHEALVSALPRSRVPQPRRADVLQEGI